MKYLLPRFRDIIFIAIFVTAVARGPRLFNGDGDLGRHLTVGTFILDNRSIPLVDSFSHTLNGQELTPHEWLAEIGFALAFRLAQLDGVVIFTALILAIAYTLLFRTLLEQGTNLLLAVFLIILATLASTIHFLARPHIFTMLFLALWMPLVSTASREGKNKHILHMAIIMWIWANTHGAYISGLVVWSIVFVGSVWEWSHKQLPVQSVRILGIGGLTSIFAVLLNPAGAKLLTTSFGYIQNSYLVDRTQEYLSPNFHDVSFLPFLIMLGLLIFGLSRRWKQLSVAEGLLAVAWTAWSLYSARNIPLFAIVVTPMIASTLQSALGEVRFFENFSNRLLTVDAQLRGIFWPVSAALLGFALAIYGFFGQRNSYDPAAFPVQAMNWLDVNPQSGNMFNYFTWGGYILYRGWPQYVVFIDGQTDFYGEAFTREYAQVITVDEDWEAILNKYRVDWAVLPIDSPLSPALQAVDWIVLYEDETAIVLRK